MQLFKSGGVPMVDSFAGLLKKAFPQRSRRPATTGEGQCGGRTER
jgi:hypothetical protein